MKKTTSEQAHKLLIANRGEIAIRIAKTAKELGIPTLSIYAEDDANSLHIQQTDESIGLEGSGSAAYLDIDQIVAIAKEASCTMIHPGYGFLSESDAFAQICAEEDLVFVGPRPEILDLFGNKIEARRLADNWGIPTIEGTLDATTIEEVFDFYESLEEGEYLMIKAVAGGGGRGMRLVTKAEDIERAYLRCTSEAEKYFGNGTVYVEKYLPKARHIEVQIIGDGEFVSHLGTRECSIQRRNQKLIEIAPCPGLSNALRDKLVNAAMLLAKAVHYNNIGTIEFLVKGGEELNEDASYYFIEANPRLQVEHTITEEVMGIDIVQIQLQEAMGASLADMGLLQHEIPEPKGYAIQLRINTEHIDSDGMVQAKEGLIQLYDLPSGEGIRVDGFGYEGYQTNPNFDTLLVKLICHTPYDHFGSIVEKALKALRACHIEGVATNISFLEKILEHPQFQAGKFFTRFVETYIAELVPSVQAKETTTTGFLNSTEDIEKPIQEAVPQEKVQSAPFLNPAQFGGMESSKMEEESGMPTFPLFKAALNPPKKPTSVSTEQNNSTSMAIQTPMPGSVVSILVKKGDIIHSGQELVVIEAMKMESVIKAKHSGLVENIPIQEGDILIENQAVLFVQPIEKEETEKIAEIGKDNTTIRPDLEALIQRKSFLWDENRAEAVAKRHKYGQYTARENLAALCDEGSFKEYGGLAIAAQKQRRTLEDLIKNTPADGLITGIGTINQAQFGEGKTRCLVMAYDFTVLAGTQGTYNHKKMDRMLHLATKWQLPVVLFAEGGGGRPGDVDVQAIAGLDIMTFSLFAALNGKVPIISIVSRYCFAGNAALAGCSDIIIATENVSIGMGGPAMIEGGGLGSFHPKEVGPAEVQTKNGVIDLLVKDEMEAVEVAKKYLAYFQGTTKDWSCADQTVLRHLIPENRRRVYDIRKIIHQLADTDSVLELRPDYGVGIITAFIRIEGRAIGLIANNPKHLGGAIDSEGATKAVQFMKRCDQFGIAILSLCDTPGIMVGPEAEKEGTVRHTAQLFIVGGQLKVPLLAIFLRKGYGLGAMAMVGGSFHIPLFTIAWPTGEFGAMGLEGAVQLGFRKELEEVANPEERAALYDKMVATLYERGKGTNMASQLEIDDVIDPMESRGWIVRGLKSVLN